MVAGSSCAGRLTTRRTHGLWASGRCISETLRWANWPVCRKAGTLPGRPSGSRGTVARRSATLRGHAVALVGFMQLGLGAALHAQAAGGGLPPGKWPVGFTRFTAADSTRALESGQPRLLDVGVWYPARPTSRARLTYREYFLDTPPHRTTLPSEDTVQREYDDLIALFRSREAPDSVVQHWLRAPMLRRYPVAGSRWCSLHRVMPRLCTIRHLWPSTSPATDMS
jgi:hypothetical protein